MKDDRISRLAPLLDNPNVPEQFKRLIIRAMVPDSLEAEAMREVMNTYDFLDSGEAVPPTAWYDPPEIVERTDLGPVHVVAKNMWWELTYLDGTDGGRTWFLNPLRLVLIDKEVKAFLNEGERLRLVMESLKAIEGNTEASDD